MDGKMALPTHKLGKTSPMKNSSPLLDAKLVRPASKSQRTKRKSVKAKRVPKDQPKGTLKSKKNTFNRKPTPKGSKKASSPKVNKKSSFKKAKSTLQKPPVVSFPVDDKRGYSLNRQQANPAPEVLYKQGRSNKLDSAIDRVEQLSTPISMWVTTQRNQTIESCTWTDPEKTVYNVTFVDGIATQIVSPNFDAVPAEGVSLSREAESNSCNITIAEVSLEHLGIWECKVYIKGVKDFQIARITAFKTNFVTNVRLPTHLTPLRYNLTLTPFIIEGNFTVDGKVDIELKVNEGNVKNITLHSKFMEIHESDLKVDDGEVIGHGYDEDREFYIVYLKNVTVKKSDILKIHIPFTTDLREDLAGFYRSSYVNEDGQTTYLATTQFQSTDARAAFPCFDEPNLKATFRTTLGRWPNMTSISNMPQAQTGVKRTDDPNYVWDIYQETVKMSTYLLAFVISDFKFREGKSLGTNSTRFRIWTKSQEIKNTVFAAEAGPKVLAYFEKKFGIPFPLPKQDMIAIPDFASGGMENWGLITYTARALLYSNLSSFRDKEHVALVVSHELSHQWFGNLVTMEWWNE